MGKATSITISLCGVIIFLIGLGFLYAMIATNMLMIIAGPFLIVAIILMVIGVYLISKGRKKWKEADKEYGNRYGIRYTKE